MRSLTGWLLILVGWLVGLAGVVLIFTGYLAIIGFPLVVLAVLAVAVGFLLPAPPVEVLEAVPTPSKPLVVSVVGVRGVCPQGYQLGSTWQIDDRGKVTPPLCRPAIAALKSALEGQPGSGDKPLVCRCPLGGERVTFAVTATTVAAGPSSRATR